MVRGISYARSGQPDLAAQDLRKNVAAIEDLNRAFRLNPVDSNVQYTRGLAYLHLGQYLRSMAYFDEAIRQDPENADAYYGRALSNFALGRVRDAQHDADNGCNVHGCLRP